MILMSALEKKKRYEEVANLAQGKFMNHIIWALIIMPVLATRVVGLSIEYELTPQTLKDDPVAVTVSSVTNGTAVDITIIVSNRTYSVPQFAIARIGTNAQTAVRLDPEVFPTWRRYKFQLQREQLHSMFFFNYVPYTRAGKRAGSPYCWYLNVDKFISPHARHSKA